MTVHYEILRCVQEKHIFIKWYAKHHQFLDRHLLGVSDGFTGDTGSLAKGFPPAKHKQKTNTNTADMLAAAVFDILYLYWS